MAHALYEILHGLKPAMVMVLVQIVLAGANIFYKLATNDGMNMEILVAYRYLFATASLAPLAFFIERKSRPKLTWMVAFQAFLCGLFGGTLLQNLILASLVLTSATFSTAMLNLIPAVTFIIAVVLRLEKLAVRTTAGKAKVVGTLISIAGAMVLTFYKGMEVNIWSTNVDLIHHDHGSHVATSQAGNSILGSILAVGSCFCYAIWLIIQTKMSTRYPCHLSGATLMCLMASIQSVVYAVCKEREWDQWKLGWNIRLLSAAYTGVLAAGLVVTLIAWGVKQRGPLFVSVFSPVIVVVVAVLGSVLLDEKLHLGSIIAVVVIVIGLYTVLWGKGKEMKRMAQLMPSKSSRELEHIEMVITPSCTNTNYKNNILNPDNTGGSSGTTVDSTGSGSNLETRKSDPGYKEEKGEVGNSSLTVES